MIKPIAIIALTITLIAYQIGIGTISIQGYVQTVSAHYEQINEVLN